MTYGKQDTAEDTMHEAFLMVSSAVSCLPYVMAFRKAGLKLLVYIIIIYLHNMNINHS